MATVAACPSRAASPTPAYLAGAELLAPRYVSYAGPDARGRWVLLIVFAFFAYSYVAYLLTSKVDRVISADIVTAPAQLPVLAAALRASLFALPLRVAVVSSADAPVSPTVADSVFARISTAAARAAAAVTGAPASSARVVSFAPTLTALTVAPALLTELATVTSAAAAAAVAATAKPAAAAAATAVADAALSALLAVYDNNNAASAPSDEITVVIVDSAAFKPAASSEAANASKATKDSAAVWTMGPGTKAWATMPLLRSDAATDAAADAVASLLAAALLPYAAAISASSSAANTDSAAAAAAALPPSAFGLPGLAWTQYAALRSALPPRRALALTVALAHAVPADPADSAGDGGVIRVKCAKSGGNGDQCVEQRARLVPCSQSPSGCPRSLSAARDIMPLLSPLLAALNADVNSQFQSQSHSADDAVAGAAIGAAGVAVTLSAVTTHAVPLLPAARALTAIHGKSNGNGSGNGNGNGNNGIAVSVSEAVLLSAVTKGKSLWDSPSVTTTTTTFATSNNDDHVVDEDTEQGSLTILAVAPPAAAVTVGGQSATNDRERPATVGWGVVDAHGHPLPPLLLLPRWGAALLLNSNSNAENNASSVGSGERSGDSGLHPASDAVASAAAAALRLALGLPPAVPRAPLSLPIP